MTELTVYSRNTCGACREAKQILHTMQIPYVEVDVDLDQASATWLRAQGFKTLPVLMVNDRELVPGGVRSLRTMRRDEILNRINS